MAKQPLFPSRLILFVFAGTQRLRGTFGKEESAKGEKPVFAKRLLSFIVQNPSSDCAGVPAGRLSRRSCGVIRILFPEQFKKDVIHGHGLAALTPVVIKASLKGSPEKYARISRILGGTDADDCSDAVSRLLKELKLDCTLTDLGIVRDDIPWMAANCMKVSAAGVANNPVVFTEKEIAALYEAAM